MERSRLNRPSLYVSLIVLAVLGLALIWTYVVDTNPGPTTSYSQLLHDAKQVTSIAQNDTKLTVVFRGDTRNPETVIVASTSVNVYQEVCDAAGATSLSACGIVYSAVQPSAEGSIISTLLISIFPVVLIGAFIYFMMRSAQRTK